MKKRAHLLITGDVTGVGYRYWTYTNAKILGLSGFVRNIENGRVEAVFEGEMGKVKEMVEKCKLGPEVSLVKNLEERWETATDEFSEFEIRH